jgi:hypothetical protein
VKRLFVNRKEKTNPGDWWSTPKHYFEEYKNDEWVDIFNLNKINLLEYDQIIVGGGGLLLNNNFKKFLSLLNNPEVVPKVIFWGVGVNSPYSKFASQKDIENDSYKFSLELNTFKNKQINVRDKQNSYKIMPCASCLHPIFDKQIEVERDFLIINHNKVRSFINHEYWTEKKNINSIDNTIENVVEEIKKSKIVYTQSYHGAYWAALCNRKSIVYKPWSTKFLNCDFPVKVLAHNMVKDLDYDIDIPEPNSNYLNECRKKNLKLYEDINSNNLE